MMENLEYEFHKLLFIQLLNWKITKSARYEKNWYFNYDTNPMNKPVKKIHENNNDKISMKNLLKQLYFPLILYKYVFLPQKFV